MNTEQPETTHPASPFVDRLAEMPRRLRRDALTDFLRETLSVALGLDAIDITPTDRLMDLGIDSLKAVEMKMRLESELRVRFSSSLLFDYPTLESLVGFLLKHTGLSIEQGPSPSAAVGHPTPQPSAVPESRSVEDLAELLSAEIDDARRPRDDHRK